MQQNLILGSSSPYRKELLERLHIDFTCRSPDIDESALPNETPKELCTRLAKSKALAIHQQYPNAIVIGSDQVAVLGDQILGKPHTRERAIEQLSAMSGKELIFMTALCIINSDGQTFETMVPTTVTMKELARETIESYLDIEEPYNCAGSAKIEKLGVALMKSVVSDDPTALIGLPLIQTVSLLAKAGYPVLPGLKD